MNLTLISAAIAAAIGFGAAWTLQGRAIDSLKLEQKDERIARDYAARAAIERNTSAVVKAQDAATVRVAGIAADRERLGADLDKLRVASEASLRVASQSLDACIADATTKGELLSHCAGRLADVSTSADSHVSDIKTLVAGWPK